MKSFKLFVLLAALFTIVQLLNADPVKISSDNVAFVYEVKAEIPTPKTNLAKFLSSDYRNSPDEFTAHDLFSKIEPVIDKRIAEAKQTPSWAVDIGFLLPQYDFDKKGFPTQINDETFIPLQNGYALVFTNPSDIGLLPVDVDTAKSLAHILQRNRNASLLVEGTIVESKEKQLNYSNFKVITLKPTKIMIRLHDGTLVGSKTI